MIFAQPEGVSDPSQQAKLDPFAPASQNNFGIHGGQSIPELVQMLQSMQHNILNKMAINSD